jgi:hypothetical protein
MAAAVVAALAAGSRFDSGPLARPDVVLLYIGAQDCAPCRTWQNGDGMLFRGSAEYARLTYREVKSPTLFDVLKDDHWPEDLRSYRDRLGPGAGVPMWVIVEGDEIVSREYGAARWRAAVLPKIRSLLR